jgi:GntR family transcriptional regulator
MSIDPASAVPLHAQLEEVLHKAIRQGDFRAGARLPSEDELIAVHTVSRTTVRTAIQSLIARGLVEIRRGKGTFVIEPVISQELTALTGFVEDLHALGKKASTQVLDRRLVAASETVARQLNVKRGASVARIQRVRLADGSPLSFDETYLPHDLGVKIMADNVEQEPIFA